MTDYTLNCTDGKLYVSSKMLANYSKVFSDIHNQNNEYKLPYQNPSQTLDVDSTVEIVMLCFETIKHPQRLTLDNLHSLFPLFHKFKLDCCITRSIQMLKTNGGVVKFHPEIISLGFKYGDEYSILQHININILTFSKTWFTKKQQSAMNDIYDDYPRGRIRVRRCLKKIKRSKSSPK